MDAAIVIVRSSSSRLPNKALMTVKENYKAIDIVIQRAKKTNLPVILATSIDPSDDVFEGVAKQNNIEIFRGSLLNKIKRWYDCFNKFKINNAILVDGDDLAFNYDVGKRALKKLKISDNELIQNPKDIVCGFFTYAINKDGLKKIFDIVNSDKTNTDVPTKFIEMAHLKTSYVDLEDHELNKEIRLTLDYQDDLDFFRKLYENVEITSNGKDIIHFLDNNKKISQINFYRQKDYLENQKKFNEQVT